MEIPPSREAPSPDPAPAQSHQQPLRAYLGPTDTAVRPQGRQFLDCTSNELTPQTNPSSLPCQSLQTILRNVLGTPFRHRHASSSTLFFGSLPARRRY